MALTTIDPTSALVVIDLQKGIVSALTDDAVTAAVKQAAQLAAEFRRHGLPVVLVNVTGRAPGRTESAWSGAGAARPAGWADLIDELDAQPGDHLITKRRRSAFHDTGLDTLLRDLGVTQIVLAGISTSSGVESTARSASDHGYHVVLATDAMTDPDADAHRTASSASSPRSARPPPPPRSSRRSRPADEPARPTAAQPPGHRDPPGVEPAQLPGP
jgi:nicotinamidase-related amidase